ncbi:MAG: hypothetical protein GC164_01070 [Phycisphaera sp.]|nr:hypothetical protein [Phycisphaera sp.]
MTTHVAILWAKYIDLILDGTKTVESRLMTNRQPPYGMVKEGDVIYFKQSGGPFRAVARAGKVVEFEGLNVPKLRAIYKEFNARVCGDRAYWQRKEHSRFATFITINDARPTEAGPIFKASAWKAWHVLKSDMATERTLEIKLTGGAIRNRYVSVTGHEGFFPSGMFSVVLPDGSEITTDVNPRKLIRYRGWRPWFERAGVMEGDTVRFEQVGNKRYRVSFPVNGSNRA